MQYNLPYALQTSFLLKPQQVCALNLLYYKRTSRLFSFKICLKKMLTPCLKLFSSIVTLNFWEHTIFFSTFTLNPCQK